MAGCWCFCREFLLENTYYEETLAMRLLSNHGQWQLLIELAKVSISFVTARCNLAQVRVVISRAKGTSQHDTPSPDLFGSPDFVEKWTKQLPKKVHQQKNIPILPENLLEDF